MKIYQRLAAESENRLLRAMRRALTKHRSIRDAARAVGMPKSTFHDKARAFGIVGADAKAR